MKKRAIGILGGLILALSPTAALSGADDYIGDTAIYTGESTSIRPNVLLLVDNSNSAKNSTGPGQAYDPSITYNGTYSPWDIWKAGQQGEFTAREVSNTTWAMENLSCANNDDIIKRTLRTSGTYTGRGTTEYPSIKNGGCDTNKAYTYALGNYLNYLETPPEEGVSYSQAQIIREAIRQVTRGNRFQINFGLAVYDNVGNKGAMIASPIRDLSSDEEYQDFLNHLPGSGVVGSDPGFLTTETARPQAEALLDAGYYFHGEPLPVSGRSALPSPITKTCDINYIIFITNGLSNKDDNTALWNTVGDFDGDGQEAKVTINYGTGGSHFLDDVAKYLYQTDASDLENMQRIITSTILAFQNDDELVRRAGLSPSGIETADPEDRGLHGRGGYYNVFNANELAAALTDALANIVVESDTSFVAPVVPASTTNRTISSNRVYIGLFKPQTQKPWVGNLKKYGVNNQNQLVDRDDQPANDENGDFISNSLSYWGTDASGQVMTYQGSRDPSLGDGGMVDVGGAGGTLKARVIEYLLDPTANADRRRKIFTHLGTSPLLYETSNAFTKANLTEANTGIAEVRTREMLVDFFDGIDVLNEDEDDEFTDTRPWVMGDILHSKPLIFNYTSYGAEEENTCYDPATGGEGNSTVIFVGSNDGMLHAFRDCDGEELWGFIPDNILPDLPNLFTNTHNYFVDASPTAYIHDYDNNGEIDTGTGAKDKVILIFGQRRGGGEDTLNATGSRGAYYALDVTRFDQPKLLAKIDSTTIGLDELGETWSQPRLAKVKVGSAVKVVAIIGAGYDNNEDLRFGPTQEFPAGVAETTDVTLPTDDSGPTVSAVGGSQINPRGRGIFVIEVATLSQDASQRWEADTSAGGTLLWKYTHAEDGEMDFSFPSDATVMDTDADGFHDLVYIGDTGGRMWRFDLGDSATSNWGADIIFDSNQGGDGNGRKIFNKPSVAILGGIPILYFGTGDRAHPLNTAVVDRLYAVRDRGQSTTAGIGEANLEDFTLNLLQASGTTTEGSSAILSRLGSESNYGWYIRMNQNSGEKALAPASVFNQQVFFTTYSPTVGVAPDPCSPGNLGTSRLYHLNYATGEAVFNYDTSNDGTTPNERAVGGDGIILARDDRVREVGVGIPSGIVTMIDASGKVTMMTSSSNRVNTYEAPDAKLITPVYWMQW